MSQAPAVKSSSVRNHSPQTCHLRHLLVGIREADGAVVSHPRHTAAALGEADAVDPAAAAARLKHQLPKWHFGSPGGGGRPLLDLFDVGRKNPGLENKKTQGMVLRACTPCFENGLYFLFHPKFHK